MPELPEVEVTRQGIAPYLEGRFIAGAVIRHAQLRWPISTDLPSQLHNRMIVAVRRRAKYLLFDCGAGTLIVHLGMSGSLRLFQTKIHDASQTIQSTFPPGKHDHFDLMLDDQSILRYRDPRRFGAIIWQSGLPERHPLLRHLGPEPLSEAFCAKYLYDYSRKRTISIKALLMNNRAVVGIGNIYANEALFHAKINPKTAVGKISLSRYRAIVQHVQFVLRRAIEAGGSSLRDFVNVNGTPGYFQQQYWVYGRAGMDCKCCGAAIKLIKQGQRSTFYCPVCQK